MSTTVFRLALFAIVCVVSGCMRSPDKWEKARHPTVPVRGIVRYDGKPVAGATVIFFPERQSLASTAVTDEDGFFILRTYVPGDGTLIGRHAVVIDKTTEVVHVPANAEEVVRPPTITHHLPEKYRNPERSGFTATVEKGRSNVFEFDLKSE